MLYVKIVFLQLQLIFIKHRNTAYIEYFLGLCSKWRDVYYAMLCYYLVNDLV